MSKNAYLARNWLDQNDSGYYVNSGDSSVSSCITYTYPWAGYQYTNNLTIRLTLSDVEHMRKVAAKDKKLKAALKKIAPYIQVEVDFP